jgi:catechol 2,3-dioxygenase-like lactoylglutathione lyase family enzyme
MSGKKPGWMGVRTDAFDGMVSIYREGLGLRMLDMREGDARFALADGTQIHVYAGNDVDHGFFGAAPVVAFEVDDFEVSRARLEAAGAIFIGSPQQDAEARWNHFRAPDGNVYEIIEHIGG